MSEASCERCRREAAEAEVSKLREQVKPYRDLLIQITQGRKCSIGSIDNVYEVRFDAAHIAAALAKMDELEKGGSMSAEPEQIQDEEVGYWYRAILHGEVDLMGDPWAAIKNLLIGKRIELDAERRAREAAEAERDALRERNEELTRRLLAAPVGSLVGEPQALVAECDALRAREKVLMEILERWMGSRVVVHIAQGVTHIEPGHALLDDTSAALASEPQKEAENP